MTALKIIDQWLHVPTLKLRAGEMTAQELRTVKAVLNGLRAELVAQMAANPTAQDADVRYEVFNEARQLVLDDSLGWSDGGSDADGRISQALDNVAEKIHKRMIAPPADTSMPGMAQTKPGTGWPKP